MKTIGSMVLRGCPWLAAFTIVTASLALSSSAVAQPAMPSNAAATAVSSSQIDLSWTDNAGSEQGFKIRRKTGAGGTYSVIATVGAVSGSGGTGTYDNTGLTANTTYYYQVQAYNANGGSNWTSAVSATTLGGSPAAPSGLAASAVSSSQINLSWTDNASNETGFKVERKTGAGGTYSQIATPGANSVGYNDTGLAPNTNYHYRVRAYNGSGNSAYSNSDDATTSSGWGTLPSGLAWSSGVWPQGNFGSGNDFNDFLTWRGRAGDNVRQFANMGAAKSGWSQWVSGVPYSQHFGYWDDGYWLIIGIPMVCTDTFFSDLSPGTATTNLVKGYHQQVIDNYKSAFGAGFTGQRVIIDLAWEFNNASYTHSIQKAEAGGWQAADWKNLWIAVRDLWKQSGNLPDAKFSFTSLRNFNKNVWGSVAYGTLFPGASKVDFIGVDAYGKTTSLQGGTSEDDSAALNFLSHGGNATKTSSSLYSQPDGLYEFMSNARYYGVGLAIPEWAINVDCSQCAPGDKGDSQAFIERTFEAFQQFAGEGRLLIENYFHGAGSSSSGDHRIYPSGVQSNNRAYTGYLNKY